jgi:hypothetical protein
VFDGKPPYKQADDRGDPGADDRGEPHADRAERATPPTAPQRTTARSPPSSARGQADDGSEPAESLRQRLARDDRSHALITPGKGAASHGATAPPPSRPRTDQPWFPRGPLERDVGHPCATACRPGRADPSRTIPRAPSLPARWYAPTGVVVAKSRPAPLGAENPARDQGLRSRSSRAAPRLLAGAALPTLAPRPPAARVSKERGERAISDSAPGM